MLVFAGFVPHSPLLLGSINRERIQDVQVTLMALKELAEELYATRPDTIVVLSSHTTMHDEAFSIHLHDPYRVSLSEFGDLGDYKTFHPDMGMVDKLQRAMRARPIPTTLNTDDILHYSAAVPLLLLTEHLPHVAVVPVTYAGLSAKEHFAAGEVMNDVLVGSSRRVALIATGDLSHALTSDSPAGFAKEGPQFDAHIQECIKNNNAVSLLQMKPAFVSKAKECAYRPLTMLFGALEHTQYWPTVHSYEAPFGVGYLVAHFELS